MNIDGTPIRIETGVSGLDDILSGGLPAGQMYLIEGDPGTGKTTIGMQFIMAGSKKGENSLYVTLSESLGELGGSARSHGWNPKDIPIAEFIPEEASLSPEQQYTVFHPSEIELATTIQKLTELIEKEKPVRLVIDSLSELRLLAADKMRYRRQLLALKHFFAGRDTTVLLLDDRTGEGDDMQLQSIVIDSLNGFLMSMPGEQDLNLHLHELLAFLNQKGVVTILIYTQHGLVGSVRRRY